MEQLQFQTKNKKRVENILFLQRNYFNFVESLKIMLTTEGIKQIILAGLPQWVIDAREQTKRLQVHINGIGVPEYLEQIDKYENDRQYELRKSISLPTGFCSPIYFVMWTRYFLHKGK